MREQIKHLKIKTNFLQLSINELQDNLKNYKENSNILRNKILKDIIKFNQ